MIHVEIPKRSRRCCLGNEAFLPGTPYWSCLTPKKGKRYERHDFCCSCWSKRIDEQPSAVSWRAKVPVKAKETTPAGIQEVAIQLLKELVPSQTDVAFALALYLERIKRLSFCQEILAEDGHPYLLYEDRVDEEVIVVKKVLAKAVDRELVQKKICERLKDGSP